jgi:hypothetical protein
MLPAISGWLTLLATRSRNSTPVVRWSEYGLTEIVAQRYDAGVRSGDQVAKDMIAVRITRQ